MKQPSPPAPTLGTKEPAAPADRVIRALALLAAISALAGFSLAVFEAPSIPENDHRLAPLLLWPMDTSSTTDPSKGRY